MPTPGRHTDSPKPREERGDGADARSTWNSGGVPAGERILREVDSIQSRLSEMSAEATGDASGGVGRLERLAMLGEISGFVAHEFNNILTPLLAHAQVALKQPRDPERMALALERVVATVKRATAVAESILELAKQDQAEVAKGGEQKLKKDGAPRGTVGAGGPVVDAGKMGSPSAAREGGGVGRRGIGRGADVARCVRRAAEEAGAEGVRIEIQAGLAVLMEEHDLQQVVLNLLLNARRSNAAQGAAREPESGADARIIVRGGAYVEPPSRPECSYIDRYLPELLRPDEKVESRQTRSDNTTCIIEVEDRGGGVAARAMRALGARGFRVHEMGSGSGSGERREGGVAGDGGVAGVAGLAGGSGLGLEICRRVVERAGGWIEIESRAGVGTTVRVHLRRAGGAGSAAA